MYINKLGYTRLSSLMNKQKDCWEVTEDRLNKSMKTFDIDPLMKSDDIKNLNHKMIMSQSKIGTLASNFLNKDLYKISYFGCEIIKST